MDELTATLRGILGEMGVNLTQLSERTGIGYNALYASLGTKGRGRDLRATEFMKICRALKLDPREFMPWGMGRSSKQ